MDLDEQSVARMKRVFIVHGWGGNSDEVIHTWLKKELSKKGIAVVSPNMPDTNHPKIDSWVNYLAKQVGKCDEDTLFFGHSIGCQPIMKYFETLKHTQKAGGAVFLSGWFNLDNMETDEEKKIAKPWIETPIDFKKVRSVCSDIEVIISDDEPYGFVKENTATFKKELNARVTIEHGKGHFTESEGVREIPEVLKILTRMLKSS